LLSFELQWGGRPGRRCDRPKESRADGEKGLADDREIGTIQGCCRRDSTGSGKNSCEEIKSAAGSAVNRGEDRAWGSMMLQNIMPNGQFRRRCPLVLGLVLAAGLFLAAPAAVANNGGDPLFCQPQEGVSYLITNSGSDVWTVDPDCFNNFNPGVPATLTSQTPITTTQGGTLTLNVTPSGGNYTYTPPSPGFTGVDSFDLTVTTEWNGAGGSGSGPANNAHDNQGPYTFTGIYAIQLNVLPAVTTMLGANGETVNVPVPAGSITGCQANQGNPGAGPPAGIVNGCVTMVSDVPPQGAPLSTQPLHGTLIRSGPTGLQYKANAGYVGPDSFTYYALGVNTDTTNPTLPSLASGQITMNVHVADPVPTLSSWAIALTMAGLLATGVWMLRRRSV
jgi:hypothetical protein